MDDLIEAPSIPYRDFRKFLPFLCKLVRFGCCGVIAYVGFLTFDSIRTIFQPSIPASANSRTSDAREFIGIPEMLGSSPANGYWKFDNLEWNFGTSNVSEALVGQRLRVIESDAACANFPINEADGKILQFLTRFMTALPENGGGKLYQYQTSDMQIQIGLSDSESGLHLQSGAMAVRTSNSDWQVLELTREDTEKKSGVNGKESQHLLPLPTQCNVIATRMSETGEMLLEIVQVNEKLNLLADTWRESGWEVLAQKRLAYAGVPLVCRQRESEVQAWSFQSKDGKEVLVISRIGKTSTSNSFIPVTRVDHE